MRMFSTFNPQYSDDEKAVLKEVVDKAINKFAGKFSKYKIGVYRLRGNEFGFGLKSDDIKMEVQLIILSGDVMATVIIYVPVNTISDLNNDKAIMIDSLKFKAVGMCIKFPEGFSEDSAGFIVQSLTFPVRSVETRADDSVRWYIDSDFDDFVDRTIVSLDILSGMITFFCKDVDISETEFNLMDDDCDIRVTSIPKNVKYIKDRVDDTIESVGNSFDDFEFDAVEPCNKSDEQYEKPDKTEKTDSEKSDSEMSVDELNKLMEEGFEPPEKYKDIYKDKATNNKRYNIKQNVVSPVQKDIKLKISDIQCVFGDSDIVGFDIISKK